MNYRVDWRSAPKLKGAKLFGHAFDGDGNASFLYITAVEAEDGEHVIHREFDPKATDQVISDEDGFWENSFRQYPRGGQNV